MIKKKNEKKNIYPNPNHIKPLFNRLNEALNTTCMELEWLGNLMTMQKPYILTLCRLFFFAPAVCRSRYLISFLCLIHICILFGKWQACTKTIWLNEYAECTQIKTTQYSMVLSFSQIVDRTFLFDCWFLHKECHMAAIITRWLNLSPIYSSTDSQETFFLAVLIVR